MNAQNTTFWYSNGQVDSHFIRTDVFAFKCYNGNQYTGFVDSSIIERLEYHGDRSDMANEIYYKQTASITDKINSLIGINNSGQLEKPYLTICKDPSLAVKENKWYIVDDQILINFVNPNPDSTFIDDFCNTNGLNLVYSPPVSLNFNPANNFSYTYIFRINPRYYNFNTPDLYIEKVRDVYLNNINVVKNASPNITNLRNHQPYYAVYDLLEENSEKVSCAPNDGDWSDCWHLDNIGFKRWLEPAGTPGADVDICGCWEENLNGNNIKIAVIGFGDLNYNNQEFANNTFTSDKWDCTSGICINNLSNNNAGGISLGVMTSIISATKNNYNHTAGIADNAIITPLKIGDDFTSYASLIAAFDEAAKSNVDIIVTDFYSEMENLNFKNNLYQIYLKGRKPSPIEDPNKMIIIAPAGEQVSTAVAVAGSTQFNFPAAYNFSSDSETPEVIGVIGSDRFDKKCDWEIDVPTNSAYQYSTNYGSTYDIGAPGPILFTPFSTSSTGLPQMVGVYGHFTSNSVATTAGILALMLQKSPKIEAEHLTNVLRKSSEKVGGYVYTNGLSIELAYGRINCTRLLNDVVNTYPTQITDNHILENDYKITYTNNSWIVSFEGKDFEKGQIKLYNVYGQEISTSNINNKSVEIYNSTLPSGIYLLKSNSNSNAIKLFK